MTEQKKPLEEYLQDVETIKAVLTEYEEMGYIETWGYYAWAVCVAAGVGISLWASSFVDWTYHQFYFDIWIPICAVGGTLETIAWIVRLRRQSRPLFGKRFRKYLIAFFFIVIVGFVLMYHLLEPHLPIAGLIVLVGSVMFFLVAVLSYTVFLIEATTAFLVGCALLFAPPTPGFLTFAGLFMAAVFAAAGLHQYAIEKKPHG